MFVACAAAGVFVLPGGGVAGAAPTRTFASGESVTVPVDPADKPAVYIASDTPITYECSITGQARLARTTGTEAVTSDGVVWQQFLVINAPARGEYRLTCVDDEQAAVRYGVGRDLLSTPGGVSGLLPVLVPAAGLLVAVAGTVFVLIRRNITRKHLAVTG
ncbi:hypothetical protein E1286_10800 [Nonomuraea terrae]|uniref:Uncharacterized protein n=1 Tax=Nonomuraea terrae TaxID=2530383 RepID=A0A4V2YMP8_9ACTN|nr:hypothetical protein [Nonomuraea terrae]TDD51337.1 hypothetical protein E1286_10800 [Nonomuraea terrae]